MRALVVGRNGLIGAALLEHLGSLGWAAGGTQRRDPRNPDYLDLTKLPENWGLYPPQAALEVVYLVAATTGYARCEGSRTAWRVNVDAPIEIAQAFLGAGSFVVFLSSEAVEWSASAYARQKLAVESFLRGKHAAIMRPAKVTTENVRSLAAELARIGEAKKPGVYRWGEGPERV